MDLRHSSDDELLLAVRQLVGSQNELTAKLLAHLVEIEGRRLHLLAGFSSMFEFCTSGLGLSEGEAFRRILAARIARRFPVVYSLVASGAVHLSALELLRDYLTEENHAELLRSASRKSKREVETLLAARFPRPDVPSRITRARIEPLGEERFRVEFTASAKLREKLELCRDLMSHANPSHDLAVIVERGIDLLLADLQRKRLAHAKRPRRATREGSKPGRVTRAVRREVFERDGLRCTYVSPDDRRCEARAFLELDHAKPRALGGADQSKNLRVRCRAHNQLAAEEVFGREHVERSRHFRQRKWTSKSQGRHAGSHDLSQERPLGLLEKTRQALRALGFHENDAKRAISRVERALRGPHATLEQVVREAILVATAPGFGR
jgi:5-methylcytosine-specific restriction endonuclease McrA